MITLPSPYATNWDGPCGAAACATAPTGKVKAGDRGRGKARETAEDKVKIRRQKAEIRRQRHRQQFSVLLPIGVFALKFKS